MQIFAAIKDPAAHANITLENIERKNISLLQ
jgi:hypothetical protein